MHAVLYQSLTWCRNCPKRPGFLIQNTVTARLPLSMAAGSTLLTTGCSETRRKYVPVGLGPASMRATVSEQPVATHVYVGRLCLGWPAVNNSFSGSGTKLGPAPCWIKWNSATPIVRGQTPMLFRPGQFRRESVHAPALKLLPAMVGAPLVRGCCTQRIKRTAGSHRGVQHPPDQRCVLPQYRNQEAITR
jgi:hypothetical protein